MCISDIKTRIYQSVDAGLDSGSLHGNRDSPVDAASYLLDGTNVLDEDRILKM